MENKRKRNVLDKQIGFMDGVREKWCAVFILYSFVILTTQIMYKIDPTVYMNFVITVGSLFILGGSVDSAMKIQAAKTFKEKELNNSSKTTEE